MKYLEYFRSLGYKIDNSNNFVYVVKDFQRHCGLVVDGVIGKETLKAMKKFNKDNYCPEVFEPIKPYIEYSDDEIECLCKKGLVGLGKAFNYHSKINNFDVLHNLAHAILESDWGTSYIAKLKNNLYGWRAYDDSPYESANHFTSKERCIEKWSKWFNKEYLETDGKYFNGNNEYGVNIRYATSPIAGINKSFIVRSLRMNIKKNMILTKNFKYGEFWCGDIEPPEEYFNNIKRVAENLQKLRDYFKRPIKITSGYRTPEHNKEVGGKPNSYHLVGLAADIKIDNIEPETIFEIAYKNTEFKGFGIGLNFIHLDLRDKFRLWAYQKFLY